MTKQKAIKIAKDRIARCTSFVQSLDEDEKQHPDLSKDKLIEKIRWMLRTLVTSETEILQEIIEQIDSKKPAKPLRH